MIQGRGERGKYCEDKSINQHDALVTSFIPFLVSDISDTYSKCSFRKYSNIVFRNIDHVSKGKNHQSGGGTVHKTQRIFNKFKHR